MFLLGCAARFLDDVLDVCGNPHAQFLFLLLFPGLVKQEEDWGGLLASLPGLLVIWLLATYLTFRQRVRPTQAAGAGTQSTTFYGGQNGGGNVQARDR
jgi:hypothetical protein